MSFIVEETIWDKFPEMLLVVAYASDVDNSFYNQELTDDFRIAQQDLKEQWTYPNAQSHPNIAAWRTTFRSAMGLKGGDFPASIEALAKRVLSGKGIGSINSVVDFYNLLSLQHVVPVGGWDVDGFAGGDIELRLTRSDESFRELGSPSAISVGAGEVCYADAEALITRHFVWRQAEEAKVTSDTHRVFLVSEILPEVGAKVAADVAQAFSDGLESYFEVTCHSNIMSAGDTRWDWLGAN
jgi:DNA/RNA-binding domain of Phe-tRNA-synthetase-like protein